MFSMRLDGFLVVFVMFSAEGILRLESSDSACAEGDAKVINYNYYGSVTQNQGDSHNNCDGSLEDTSNYNITWSDWGECSVPCGANGIQQRTAPCPGHSTTETCLMRETRTCNKGPCKACSTSYPLIDGSVYNVSYFALTASQYHASSFPSYSRLNDCPSSRMCCSWETTHIINPGEWIQVDFSQQFRITKIATQGRGNPTVNRFVASFKAGFSNDGTDFDFTQELTGNTDNRAIVENEISGDPVARYVRILVVGYNGRPSLRWEVYGCPAELSVP